jgi:hypothetical protein
MESSQENDLTLANQLQAEEDALQKNESIIIETDKQTTLDVNGTGVAHDESDDAMTIEQTSTDRAEELNPPNDTTAVPPSASKRCYPAHQHKSTCTSSQSHVSTTVKKGNHSK